MKRVAALASVLLLAGCSLTADIERAREVIDAAHERHEDIISSVEKAREIVDTIYEQKEEILETVETAEKIVGDLGERAPDILRVVDIATESAPRIIERIEAILALIDTLRERIEAALASNPVAEELEAAGVDTTDAKAVAKEAVREPSLLKRWEFWVVLISAFFGKEAAGGVIKMRKKKEKDNGDRDRTAVGSSSE